MNNPAELCFLCDQEVSQSKIVYFEGRAFCPSHRDVFKKGAWKILKSGHATPEDPEFGVRLYEAKKLLLKSGKLSFIETDYAEIGGEIVTQMRLKVLKEDLERAQALSKSLFS